MLESKRKGLQVVEVVQVGKQAHLDNNKPTVWRLQKVKSG